MASAHGAGLMVVPFALAGAAAASPHEAHRLAGAAGDLALIDQVADLLLSADAGDAAAETKLAELYLSRPELRLGRRVRCASPTGAEVTIDLEERGEAT